jgi:cytochrome d ubiquinol oxidase subunit I
MVGLGVVFIVLTLFASYLRWRGVLFEKRWLLWIFVIAIAGPFIANEVGWAAAEVGRQPWIVHPNVIRDESGQFTYNADGFLRYDLREGLLTGAAVSENITSAHLLTSIGMFGVIYGLLFFVWLYVLNDKIQHGPKPVMISGVTTGHGLLEAAAGRTLHEESMSEAKDSPTGDDARPEPGDQGPRNSH